MIVNEQIELDAPLIDVHGHTLDQAFKSQKRFHHSLGGLTDLPLMRAGGVAAQLTACWVPDAANGGPHASPDPLRLILQMADYFDRELKGAAGDHATLATSASDIEAARGSGKTAFVFGLEGGDCLQGDLSVLRTLHRLGLRHLGLVHEGRNALGSATQVWEGPLMRLYDERIDRFLPERFVGTAEVDEIRVVGDRVRDAETRHRFGKEPHILVGERLGPPLVVVLGENLHAVAALLGSNFHCLVVATGNRHVGSENRHGLNPLQCSGC